MGTTFRMFLSLAVVMAVIGCGKSNNVSKEAAQQLAAKHTPLRTVVEARGTPPGPVKWVIYGSDESGRKLAVWVTQRVEGYVYLDTGISAAEALAKVAAKGVKVTDNEPVLVGPSDPYWFFEAISAAGVHYGIRVFFTTGEITIPSNVSP